MKMNLKANASKAPMAASPLWIIALFITLSEVMAGVAAIGTDGGVRLIFAIFACAFPTAIFATFIWLLLRHTQNLYAPGQFTKNTPLEVFARTMTNRARDTEVVMAQAISEAVIRSVVEELRLGPPSGESLEAQANIATKRQEEVAHSIERFVEASSVVVDLSHMVKNAEPLHIPVTSNTTVSQFLDTVYWALSDVVEPMEYPRIWLLVDDEGRSLTEMGRTWASEKHGWPSDHRPLVNVGITPGSHLTAIRRRELKREQLRDF